MSPQERTGQVGAVTSDPVLVLEAVTKTYPMASGAFKALDGVNLDARAGEFIAVVGKSGSGKSTLLNIISGIDRPSAGAVIAAGTRIHALAEGELARWRGVNVGVVFQFFQLLPTLTVAENVMLPMDFCGIDPPGGRRRRAAELLERMGIVDQADKLPLSLSGGQQQRAAIARALANDPPLVVADEPTGNLDSQTAGQVLRLLAELARNGKTVIIVTHARDIGDLVDRTVEIADGRIVATGRPCRADQVKEVAYV